MNVSGAAGNMYALQQAISTAMLNRAMGLEANIMGRLLEALPDEQLLTEASLSPDTGLYIDTYI